MCGSLVCESCLKMWTDKNMQNNITFECPMRCKRTSDIKESIMKPIGKVIKNILYQMEVKCPNDNCGKFMTLDKYEEHEYYCYLPKCQNGLCGTGSEKMISVLYFNPSIRRMKVWSIVSVLKCVNIHLYSNV
jgi:hypothetical protein